MLDGNLGIGSDPIALLRRAHQLLTAGGAVLAEVGEPMAGSRRLALRLRLAHELSKPFPWAVADRWRAGGRWFVELRRC